MNKGVLIQVRDFMGEMRSDCPFSQKEQDIIIKKLDKFIASVSDELWKSVEYYNETLSFGDVQDLQNFIDAAELLHEGVREE